MRVHRLALTAFGPFAERVEVDLDDLGRDGLFLLWGPTGAGKTTLLDGVVYALYGTVPGARGEEKRLRSDHASSEVRTQVECEVTLGSERLLVTRRPEQQRPKRRGTGFTTEQARLTVQRWAAGSWEPVSTRIDEGSDHLRTRLGLSAEQFCQVVLLPQGDFARFLRAEPEDRSRLLRTLFDVGRFARVESWLDEQRRAARTELDVVRTRASTLLARVAQVADVDVPEELAPELVGVAPAAQAGAWLHRVRTEVAERLTELEKAATAAADEVGRVDAALAAARAEEQRHARRDRARAQLARLQAEAAELVPLRAALDGSTRAEPVRDVLEAAGRAGLAAEAADQQLASVRRAWATVSAGRAADTLLARALRDEVAELRRLVPEVDRADQLARSVARTGRQVAELVDRCAAAEVAATGWPDRLAAQEAVVAAAAEAEARLPGATATLERARASLTAARAAQEASTRVEQLRSASSAAREAWLDAREAWGDLRTRRLDGMAAELAAGLAEGADCPVCGAVEHPRLARHDGPLVTQADEDAARLVVEEREGRSVAAQRALEEIERELAGLRAQAGALPLEEQELVVAAAREAERSVRGQASTLGAARQQLTALVAARDDALAAWAAAREELVQRRAELAAAEQSLAEVREQLTAARGEDPDLPARIRRLTSEAERCEALVDAEGAEVRARTAADTARRFADERVAEAGFPDLLAAADALLESGRAAGIRRRVTEHDQQWSVVTATLAEPELADLAPRPDLAAITDACRSATAVREEAVAALADARRCTSALDALAADLTAVEVELDEHRATAEQVSALADLVNGRGQNALKMRLQSFVLAARLEQVAEVASRRLRDMSGGRYTFLHSDAQGRHGARGGLGLDVLDEYTGLRRPTKTLSGGESFMASLALALGLADVVTAESGGVQIDTLFVDEGFGTLDPQSLDSVMTVLDELRRGGRTVGLISHVEELRTRITSRLEVLSGRNGSRLAA
ncbi:AAA family ATPase [Modestobacter versicolor]|uniref:Nuclease SbcCD subunit C n=1 Tax=Modestobacter versicolor TaxID=429133 RepID=A0A323VE86_9ACTN|nr:SMC family ATPase [Modestobacter versicolor]MBB3678217.1 exonuclease SbcC [Modestobacter versicolor]PZA23184.1 SMC family ATPase [Modestobacter versicolor]